MLKRSAAVRDLPYQKESRVELIRTSDPDTRLAPGDQGSVIGVDGLGTVHVAWDSGSQLGMCVQDGQDVIRLVD